MAAKLYPPYIEGTIPAFCMKYDGAHKQKVGADITIPFTDYISNVAASELYPMA